MDLKITIATDENLVSPKIANALSAKGCSVVFSDLLSGIPDETQYLVVVSMNTVPSKVFIDSVERVLPKTLVVQKLNDFVDINFTFDFNKIIFDQLLPLYFEGLLGLRKLVNSEKLYVAKGEKIYVATANNLVSQIEGQLFGFSQNTILLSGRAFYPEQLVGIFAGRALSFIDNNASPRFQLPEAVIFMDEYINGQTILGTLPEVSQEKITPVIHKENHLKGLKIPKIKPRIPKAKISKKGKRIIKSARYAYVYILFMVIGLLVLPFGLFASSLAASGLSVYFIKQGNFSSAAAAIDFSSNSARVATNMFNVMSHIPVLGDLPRYAAKRTNLIANGSRAAGRVLALTSYAGGLSADVLSGDKNIEEIARGLHLELDALYKDLSFLQSQDLSVLPMSDLIPHLDSLDKYRGYVLAASEISESLPSLLGYDRTKTYMLLLQNNMELRPTGGFIGSFALVSFDKGKMIDNTVYDVYSADGQLKGYVKPPGPIEEHLGEASWSLRDSNWDPDFPTSARRAEWFLDKTIDRQVDGVIGINLEVVKKYLEATGPIELPDFNDTITSDNLYEKVQYEVEDSFFPGSRKKAQYLSALSTAIINRVLEADSATAAKLLASTVKGLDSRDFEIYIHDSGVNEILHSQHWDGAVTTSYCGEPNCIYAFAGLVEANLGVNKANYFVKRQVSLKNDLSQDILSQELTLEIKNNAPNKDKIPEQRYKNYVRAIAPGSSTIKSVVIEDKNGRRQVAADVVKLEDRNEYGALLDVEPAESAHIIFTWTMPVDLNTKEAGVLRVGWWKQSGTGEYLFSTEFLLPNLGEIATSPALSLTTGHSLGYNTNLSEDKTFQVLWKGQK